MKNYNLEVKNPPNLVNPCFGKDDLWIKSWHYSHLFLPFQHAAQGVFICVFRAFCVKNEASHALRWNEKMKE